MRRRLIVVAAAALVLIAGCSATPTGGSSGSTIAGLGERTATVASIGVTVRPVQLDAGGAAFAVSLDTHAGSLSADLAASSRLEVGGTTWSAAGWDGDPTGGHHRKGTLRFTAAGAPTGTVTLTLSGLGDPVVFTWQTGP
jgi:hypothetical protein